MNPLDPALCVGSLRVHLTAESLIDLDRMIICLFGLHHRRLLIKNVFGFVDPRFISALARPPNLLLGAVRHSQLVP